MRISIVIVNWNVKDLLRECLRSVFSSKIEDEPEVVVVDNASSDESAAMVRSEFPQVNLIAAPENLGFAKGNNVGVAAAKGDFIFLLNPDTRLEPDTLVKLRDYLAANPEVGVVAPQLLWPDGSPQSSRRQFPTIGSLFWESTLLEQWFPQNKIAQRYKFAGVPPTQSGPVDWAVGAALFLRREVWESVGPLDESLFMYFEETDWCRRCTQAGWPVQYLSDAGVTHYEGQSSGQVVSARTLRFQRSKIRYTQKWFGSMWAAAIKLFLRLTFGFQLAEETAKWLLGHKRPLRRERMAAYSDLLKEL